MAGNSTGKKPMSDSRIFVDTNVLVYCYSQTDAQKQQKALVALQIPNCLISTQVVNEFCNVCIKKLRFTPMRIQQIVDEILELCDLTIIDRETIRCALIVQRQYGFSYYDSLIIASAIESGCEYLFSEDLSDGQIIDGVTVRNIFADGV
jgi:predicted nucleic acid-binding protein